VSLQDLGSFGGFLGAVAVLVSLIYLAVQIRQNTRSVRSAGYQSLSTSLSDLAVSVAKSADLARIWQTGMTDPGQLSGVERVRLQAFLTAAYRQYQNLYFQNRQLPGHDPAPPLLAWRSRLVGDRARSTLDGVRRVCRARSAQRSLWLRAQDLRPA
jgi:hypothetical protein